MQILSAKQGEYVFADPTIQDIIADVGQHLMGKFVERWGDGTPGSISQVAGNEILEPGFREFVWLLLLWTLAPRI